MKKRKLMSFLLASVFSLSVISGCNASGNNSADNSEIDELRQKVKDLSAEIEELRGMLTLPDGTLYGEGDSISDEEAVKIDNLLLSQRQTVLSDGPKSTPVKQRDWDKYASHSAKDMLTHNEAVFYDRLDKACREFFENPKSAITKASGSYFMGGVTYKDLNLTRDTAYNVLVWFKYNNPQYYFLGAGASISSSSLYMLVFDFAAELEDFGKTTNELFDKLDSWIEECSDDETTNYQKLVSINKKICEAIIYDPVVSNRDNKYTEEQSNAAAGEENQSMYSVLMTPETVCAGYAQTLTAMANAMDIDALTALSTGHAWNTVKFDDGKYYYIDACWNDEDESYNTKWFGVGSLYANDTDHIYATNTSAVWAPQIEYNDYRVTDKDLGGEAKSITKPVPEITGSGNTAIKLEWEAVPNAEQYQVQAYSGGVLVRNALISNTFDYIPYADGADSINVMIRAAYNVDKTNVYSDWAELTITDKGSDSKPSTPSNLKKTDNDDGGFMLNWKNKTNSSILICYGTDSTLSKATMSYAVKNQIGWKTWNPTETNYFRIVAASEADGNGTYSEPLSFSYNKEDGIEVLEEGSESTETTVSAPDKLNITLNPATETTGRNLSCEWTKSSDADSYEFQLSRKEDFSVIAGSLNTRNASVTCNNLSETSIHYYARVRSVKEENGKQVYSKWTTADIVIPDSTGTSILPSKPAVPQNLKGQESGNKKIISWDKVEGATGYVVTLYKDAERTQVSKKFNTEKTTITLSPFTAGKTYYFSICSVSSKNGKDVCSDEFNFIVKFQGETPAAPQNISGKADGNSEIISWDKVEGATGYVVTMYNDAARKEVYNEFLTNAPTIKLGPFTVGQTYYFAVRAVKTVDGKEVYSDYSNFRFLFKGTSTSESTEKPAAPQNVKINTDGNNEIISWDKVEGATGYVVTMYNDSARKEVYNDFKTNVPSITLGPFNAEQTYYFAVRAVKTVDGKEIYSNYSNFHFTFMGSTTTEKLATPNSIGSKESGKNVVISWNPVSGADGYVITVYKDSSRNEIANEFKSANASISLVPNVPGRTYYFSVRSVKNVDGKEVYSDYAHAKFTFKGTLS